jgi:hypothetical protein
MTVKTHLAVAWQGKHGWCTDTLCGRESGQTIEQNSETIATAVTCKVCKQIMDNPKHWKHRKHLKK